MFLRIWRSITLASNSEQYHRYLLEKVVPSYQAAESNAGVLICRYAECETVIFMLLSFWESEEALARFNDKKLETLISQQDERKLLLAVEPLTVQYEVVNTLSKIYHI